MHILLVNLHSSHNAGDHALTVEAIRQFGIEFDKPKVALAMNDPSSYRGPEEVIGSFHRWVKNPRPNGGSNWYWFRGPLAIFQALLAALLWRVTGRMPRLLLSEEQYRLLNAYAEAHIVVSCAGNFLYSSGRLGIPFLLSIFTIAYGWLLNKPLYSLPQSVGPLHRSWDQWLVQWLAQRINLLMVREVRSAELLEQLGVEAARYRLVPDIAFAYPDCDIETAAHILREKVGDTFNEQLLLGITAINWGAQNRHFQQQEQYEEAICAAIRAYLTQTTGHVILFCQVCGPSEGEDDRIPARRIAARVGHENRVHLVDQPLPPALLKGCYRQLDMLLGTRMHSIIFAMSEGTPVLAIGYRSKTQGMMRMLGMEEWLLDIEEAVPQILPERLLQAWNTRAELRSRTSAFIPTVKEEAGRAAHEIAVRYNLKRRDR